MNATEDDPSFDETEQDDTTELLRRMLGRLALSGAGVDIDTDVST